MAAVVAIAVGGCAGRLGGCPVLPVVALVRAVVFGGMLTAEHPAVGALGPAVLKDPGPQVVFRGEVDLVAVPCLVATFGASDRQAPVNVDLRVRERDGGSDGFGGYDPRPRRAATGTRAESSAMACTTVKAASALSRARCVSTSG